LSSFSLPFSLPIVVPKSLSLCLALTFVLDLTIWQLQVLQDLKVILGRVAEVATMFDDDGTHNFATAVC
jgi:hypothetical protein